MGLCVSSLQLDMLELKLVEVLAHLGEPGSLFGVIGGQRLDHGGIQRLQGIVEISAALPLAGLAFQEHRLGQLAADLDNGVQAGHGVLEDHGDLVAPNLVELLLADLQQVLAVIDDLAGLGDGVVGLNAQNCLGGHGLAGAGLAHNGQGLALGQVKVNTPNSLNLTVGGAEGDPQVAHLQFGFHQSSSPLVVGLKASRRPLPNRLKEIISRLRKMLGHSSV